MDALRWLPSIFLGHTEINSKFSRFLSENSDDVIKSEISLVHEIALKRNMNVDFKVGETLL